MLVWVSFCVDKGDSGVWISLYVDKGDSVWVGISACR